MIRYAVPLLMVFCLVSCMNVLTPNPVLIQKINAQFETDKSETYSTSGKFQHPIAYAVGQYVVTGMTSPSGRSVMKTAIVGKEQKGWIVETHVLTQNSESITQMLVLGMESVYKTGRIDGLDIVWVKMKPDDRPAQRIEGPMLAMAKGLYKKMLGGLEFQTQAMSDGGLVKVPAGTFEGTSKIHSDVTFMGKKYLSDAWLHPSVPINAMVKSVSNGGETVIELLDFGLTGATPSF